MSVGSSFTPALAFEIANIVVLKASTPTIREKKFVITFPIVCFHGLFIDTPITQKILGNFNKCYVVFIIIISSVSGPAG